MRASVVVVVCLLVACVSATQLRTQDGPSDVADGPADWSTEPVLGPSQPGQFVPFGKHVPRKPDVTYFTMTGVQECLVCKGIILASNIYGKAFYNLCGTKPEAGAMCNAQLRVLQSCPEFVNNWCYQDLGGTQQLRSPCPDYLTCHYCLGLNPLHCQGAA